MSLITIVEPSPQPEPETIFITSEEIFGEEGIYMTTSILSFGYIDNVIDSVKSVSNCNHIINMQKEYIFSSELMFALLFFVFGLAVMCSRRYYRTEPKTYIVEENAKTNNV